MSSHFVFTHRASRAALAAIPAGTKSFVGDREIGRVGLHDPRSGRVNEPLPGDAISAVVSAAHDGCSLLRADTFVCIPQNVVQFKSKRSGVGLACSMLVRKILAASPNVHGDCPGSPSLKRGSFHTLAHTHFPMGFPSNTSMVHPPARAPALGDCFLTWFGRKLLEAGAVEARESDRHAQRGICLSSCDD